MARKHAEPRRRDTPPGHSEEEEEPQEEKESHRHVTRSGALTNPRKTAQVEAGIGGQAVIRQWRPPLAAMPMMLGGPRRLRPPPPKKPERTPGPQGCGHGP